MSPLTAVTFMLVASALWLETGSLDGHRGMRWLARAVDVAEKRVARPSPSTVKSTVVVCIVPRPP